VGNVAETVNLSSVLTAGLTMSGLPASVSVQPNQSLNIAVTLTPAANTPLNSTLAATVTAQFNPLDAVYDQSISIPVRVVVPGVGAIASASHSARQLGSDDLAGRLDEFAKALTNLVQNPTDEVFKSQAIAALDALIPLIDSEQYLETVVPSLT